MPLSRFFSPARWWCMVRKECLQLLRDRITLAMIVVIPIVQLLLFGYAINTDPKNMPTLVLSGDSSELTRDILATLENTTYFDIVGEAKSEADAERALAVGDAQFVLTIPPDFTKRTLRGERPSLLMDADATDPMAVGSAFGAVGNIPELVSARFFQGTLAGFGREPPAFEIIGHRRYNPEGLTTYNIVPGMMGVILTLTMVLMTSLAITKERERGTMENLLSMPLRPLEVMTGKIIPYIAIGLTQSTIILLGAKFVFDIPVFGKLTAVYAVFLLFVATNLTVGITLSSLARNQLQAMQLAVFYFLPNMMLSGFFFPFRGMPGWAQAIGNLLPLTYFNRLIRGILLKGNDWPYLWPSIWPLLIFTCLAMTVAVRVYRRTLD